MRGVLTTVDPPNASLHDIVGFVGLLVTADLTLIISTICTSSSSSLLMSACVASALRGAVVWYGMDDGSFTDSESSRTPYIQHL